MDTINDELLACYVEGIATPEEQTLVRDYLTKNPEEYERVLYMMDLDREDYIGEMMEEDSSNILSLNDSINTNIALSAAAFVPQKSMCAINHLSNAEKPNLTNKNTLRINGLQERLCKILDKIEE